MVHHQAVFHLKPDASSCWRKTEFREDTRSSACPLRTAESRQRHYVPGLAAASSRSEQWASSKSAGRAGDRGNPMYQRSPGHVPKESSFQRTTWQTLRAAKGGVKQPKRKLENNEEVDVTPLPLERLRVGAPDPAGIRVCSLKLIDKNKAQFPRWPFPCCRSCCIFILLL